MSAVEPEPAAALDASLEGVWTGRGNAKTEALKPARRLHMSNQTKIDPLRAAWEIAERAFDDQDPMLAYADGRFVQGIGIGLGEDWHVIASVQIDCGALMSLTMGSC